MKLTVKAKHLPGQHDQQTHGRKRSTTKLTITPELRKAAEQGFQYFKKLGHKGTPIVGYNGQYVTEDWTVRNLEDITTYINNIIGSGDQIIMLEPTKQ